MTLVHVLPAEPTPLDIWDATAAELRAWLATVDGEFAAECWVDEHDPDPTGDDGGEPMSGWDILDAAGFACEGFWTEQDQRCWDTFVQLWHLGRGLPPRALGRDER